MKPKLANWYMIAWMDGEPQVGLCTDAYRLEFFFPEGGACGGTSFRVEELDSTRQVVEHLGGIKIPSIPAFKKQFRLEKKPKKVRKPAPVNTTTQIREIVSPLVNTFTMYNDRRKDGSRRLKFISMFTSINEHARASIEKDIKAALKKKKIKVDVAEWGKTENRWNEFRVIY